MTLNELRVGETGIIKDIHVSGNIRRRLLDLGMIPETKIKCVNKAPNGGMTAYKVRESVYALRAENAEQIDIELSNGD